MCSEGTGRDREVKKDRGGGGGGRVEEGRSEEQGMTDNADVC